MTGAAERILAAGKDMALLAAAARDAQERAESALADRSPDLERIACGPGCGQCCMVNVSVLLPEAAAVAEYLFTHFDRNRLALLQRRLEELFRSIRWLEDEDRPFVRASCAFLDERESCMIHPVRPLLCRSVTSTDPERCRDALAAQVFGDPPLILSNLFQARLFEEAFLALGRALANTGIETRSRTLTESVLELLENPPECR